MKSYTDIEQSKKLAEILPLESADMFLAMNGMLPVMSKYIDDGLVTADETSIPCWSLAALLDILPDGTDVIKDKSDTENEKYMCTVGIKDNIISTFANNPVDACVEMIVKLNKIKLL